MLKVLVAVIVLLIIIGIAMLGKKIVRSLIFRSAKTKNSESIWLEVVTGLVTVVVAFAYYWRNEPDATIVMWLGVLVFFLGGLLQLICRKQLNDDRTFEDRLSSGFEAAQTGIYAKLRYPSKTALLLIILGFSLAMGSWWAVTLLLILFWPSTIYRISQEEQALLDKFGERWLAYKAESKKIMPEIF